MQKWITQHKIITQILSCIQNEQENNQSLSSFRNPGLVLFTVTPDTATKQNCRCRQATVKMWPHHSSSLIDCQSIHTKKKLLKFVVHVIIIDQWNQIPVTIIHSRAMLVAVSQSAMKRGLSVKPGLGHWQTVQTKMRHYRTRRLIRVCAVCLISEWNSLKSPFRTMFQAYSQSQSTHQCCQCFDFFCWPFLGGPSVAVLFGSYFGNSRCLMYHKIYRSQVFKREGHS